ncbi:aminopeptidase P family protein, partial [Mycobacterium kansasii]
MAPQRFESDVYADRLRRAAQEAEKVGVTGLVVTPGYDL